MIDNVVEGKVQIAKTMEAQISVVEKSLRRHKRLYTIAYQTLLKDHCQVTIMMVFNEESSTRLSTDKFESNLTEPEIGGYHENAPIKTFKMRPYT